MAGTSMIARSIMIELDALAHHLDDAPGRGIGAFASIEESVRIDIAPTGAEKTHSLCTAGATYWPADNPRIEVAIADGHHRPLDAVEELTASGSPGFHLIDRPNGQRTPGVALDIHKVAMLKDTLSLAHAAYAFEGRLVFDWKRSSIAVATEERTLSYSRSAGRVTAIAMSTNGRELATKSHTFDGELIDESRIVNEVLEHAKASGIGRSAMGRADPARYDLLLEPAAAAVLVHEVIGHVLERDVWESLAQKHDIRMPVGLSVVADAPSAGDWTFAPVDDSGELLQREPLVAGGQVVRLIGPRSDDHRDVRRASWRDQGLHRMRSLHVAAFGHAELAASARPRLNVHEFSGAALSPKSGICLLEIEHATLERGGGELAVSGNRLRVSVSELLEAIKWTSPPALHSQMLCIKAGQKAPVQFYTGSMFLEGVEVS